jgi:HK97 family phage major capsid protein
MMNRTLQGLIRAAADNATKGTLWSDSLANGTPATLLGRPVYDAVDMDNLPTATGTKYPIAFGDFASAYQIVDRVGLNIMRDDYTGAGTGVVKFHARYRVGGKPTLTEPVVLIKSTKA